LKFEIGICLQFLHCYNLRLDFVWNFLCCYLLYVFVPVNFFLLIKKGFGLFVHLYWHACEFYICFMTNMFLIFVFILVGCYFLVDSLMCMYKFVLVYVSLTDSLSFFQVWGSISLLMVSSYFKSLHLQKNWFVVIFLDFNFVS
jgi:hypothetical protein